MTPPYFQYIYSAKLPTPGAMAYGLESEMMPFRPLIGPAIGARQFFATLSPTPQAYQAVQTGWASGIGGVQHGQSILQPLTNPYA